MNELTNEWKNEQNKAIQTMEIQNALVCVPCKYLARNVRL